MGASEDEESSWSKQKHYDDYLSIDNNNLYNLGIISIPSSSISESWY